MNNYTIVDLFEEKDVLNHPVSRILSKYFCKDIIFIILNYSNPEPEETSVVPKKINVLWELINNNKSLISDKTKFPIIIYYEKCISEEKMLVKYIDVEANIGFGYYKLIQKKYEVCNTFIPQYDIPKNDILEDIIWMKEHTKYLNGFNVSPEPVFYNTEASWVYFDKEGKYEIELDYVNYCNALEIKKIYVDFFSYDFFENFIIYPIIFDYLLYNNKTIEDLNYAVSFSMHIEDLYKIDPIFKKYDISDYYTFKDEYKIFIIENIEIKFGKEKLRNFKYLDYKNNAILYEFCTDLTHYNNFLYDETLLECRKKCNDQYKLFWCGIEFINKDKCSLGNFCAICEFDPYKKSFFLSGDCA
jgi:hypothetical protein